MADLEKLRQNLTARGYACQVFDTPQEAVCHLQHSLPGRTIGFGGSLTVREMGLFEALSRDNTCYWHWEKADTDQAARAQVYISSLNGVAETGELVNIDGAGNRVASGLYGHEKVIFIPGPEHCRAEERAAAAQEDPLRGQGGPLLRLQEPGAHLLGHGVLLAASHLYPGDGNHRGKTGAGLLNTPPGEEAPP